MRVALAAVLFAEPDLLLLMNRPTIWTLKGDLARKLFGKISPHRNHRQP